MLERRAPKRAQGDRRASQRGDGEDFALMLEVSIFQNLLGAAAEEMGVVLQRSAFSPNIKERRDFSCAVFDSNGDLAAQAAHIPVHLGAAAVSVHAVLAEMSLAPGESALLNDPYRGGTHLPDVTMVTPVYVPGVRRAVGYVASRAHHADV